MRDGDECKSMGDAVSWYFFLHSRGKFCVYNSSSASKEVWGSMMDTPFIVGAYAAIAGELSEQEKFYDALKSQPWVSGLEVPYMANGLREDPVWFAARMVPQFSLNVLTPIPGVMAHIDDRSWGIASPDAEGRRAALAFLREAADAMRRVNDLTGWRFFTHLALHTAPQALGDKAALMSSLDEISGWDIDGASLVVEHCDAWSDEHPVEKGFLQLSDELAAIKEVGAENVKASLNWGRCAIEGRGAELPQEHIEQVAASGLLGGMIVSGAQSKEAGGYGPWVDAHIGLHEHHSASVLTREAAGKAYRTALSAGAEYVGVKISITSGEPTERIASIREFAELAQFAERESLES
ncbi:MAG: DUF4862 family protein [Actinomycetaceae bacterium]|nr:DUF4862 family protein [Arcanobacterium sp.]MDD7687612.1 DUF4862 family protein [Actinomycetaceae bacterium]MDY5273150.1 DUF4862 family protein [Arcanobacterium sp.]